MSDVPKDVDEYLATVSPEARVTLEALRRAIRAAAPGAQELISYRIPMYKLHKTYLAAFQAFPKHCSYVTISEAVVQSLKAELKGYKTSGTTIHIKPGETLPDEIVRKIIAGRTAEIEAKVNAKAQAKA